MNTLTIPAMPEIWTTDGLRVSRYDLLGSLANWAVRQSPHTVPDNLAGAIVQFNEAWSLEEHAEIDSKRLLKEVATTIAKCPAIVAWNTSKKGGQDPVFVTRYSQPQPDYDFIDLDALARNICHEIILRAQVNKAQDKYNSSQQPNCVNQKYDPPH
jgi:hypothetical protein